MTRLPFPTFALETDHGRCRLCGTEKNFECLGTERYLGTGQKLRLCRSCALVSLGPDFTKNALADFYRFHYRDLFVHHDASDLDSPGAKLALEVGRIRAEILARDLPESARVLEIGSGYGAFLGHLHAIRPDIALFATEPDVEHRNLLLRGADPTFLKDDEILGPFDLIAAFHVFEHLTDPVGQTTKLCGLLSPGGKLAIEVPDIAADWGGWEYIQPAHCSYFSVRSLNRMIAEAGATAAYVGMHPGGKGCEDTIWAIVDPAPCHEAFVPAEPDELDGVRAHIAQYRWTAKNAVRRQAKNLALRFLGKNVVGRIQRAKAERAYRKIVES